MGALNDSQLTLWGLQAMVPAERGEQPEASSARGMKPAESASVSCPTDLMERIVDRGNMRRAYGKVKANKGAAGIDRMGVAEMREYFSRHSDELFSQIEEGRYAPSPVLRVEIPKKEKGKVRKLGIPTVVDRELERRGHRFVRYADDCMIFCRSKRAAERVCESVIRFIERKLFLKVNREKTEVACFNEVKYLGYAFYLRKGECRFRVHPDSVEAMKGRVRELTARSGAMSNEERPRAVTRFVRGWVNYFKLADMKELLKAIDKWMRRRIRMAYWKQWKRIRTRFKMLQRCGIEKGQAWEHANTRKGYWRVAGSPILATAIKTEQLRHKGYLFFSDQYERVRVS